MRWLLTLLLAQCCYATRTTRRMSPLTAAPTTVRLMRKGGCAARFLLTLRLADLVSAVLWNPDTKAAYFNRLKQLLESYNNNTRSWLEDEVWKMKELIASDARADAAIWKTTNDWDSAVQALVDQIKQRRKQLYEQVYAQK
jgi:hypothetical protein